MSFKSLAFLLALEPNASLNTTPAQTQELIVAVIDTGADVNHPALKNALWSNPGETGLDAQGRDKSSNGIDDDANGFVDDVHGWNFLDGSPRVQDEHGHGTHVAGLVAGAAGPKVRLMILKYFDAKMPDSKVMSSSNQAIAYAMKMGAKVINYSGGGDLPNPAEHALFQQTLERKIMVLAAAGNESRSNDFQGFYPASYGFENIISVASMDQRGDLLSSSNHGQKSVDVAALGKDVVSSLPGNRFGRLTGTSQATALVSGIVANLMVQFPYLIEPEQIRQRLLATSVVHPQLLGKVREALKPDLQRAHNMKDQKDLAQNIRWTESQWNAVFDDPVDADAPKVVERSLSSEGSPGFYKMERKAEIQTGFQKDPGHANHGT